MVNQTLVDKFLSTMKLSTTETMNAADFDSSQYGEIIKIEKEAEKPYYVQIGDSVIQARSNGAEYYLQDVVYVTQYGGTADYVISALRSRVQDVATNLYLTQNYDFLSGNLYLGRQNNTTVLIDTVTIKELTTATPKTDDAEEFIPGDTLIATFKLNTTTKPSGDIVDIKINNVSHSFTIDNIQGVPNNLSNEPQLFIIELTNIVDDIKVEIQDNIVSEFQLFIARESYLDKKNSVSIAPKNKYKFISSDNAEASIILKAQLRKDGLVQPLSDTSCYWFIEDPLVKTVDSSEYTIYGGKGWRYLGERNDKDDLVPSGAEQIVTFAQASRPSVGIKCIVDNNGILETSNTFKIINEAAPKLELSYSGDRLIATLKTGDVAMTDYTGYTFLISATDAYGQKISEDKLPNLAVGAVNEFIINENDIGIFNTYTVEARYGYKIEEIESGGKTQLVVTEGSLVDTASRKIERQGLFGGNGSEALTLALDNDSDVFVKTDAGEVIGADANDYLAIINVTAHAGNKDVTFDENSYITIGNPTGPVANLEFSYNRESKIAQLKIKKVNINTSSTDTKGYVEIIWKSSNDANAFVYATKKFTYNVITSNCDYDLILSKTVVNTDSTIDNDKLISIMVQKKAADGVITNLTESDGYIDLYIGSEKKTKWSSAFAISKNTKITVKSSTTDTKDPLYNFIWDEDTVEVVHNGLNGTSPFILSLSNDTEIIARTSTGRYLGVVENNYASTHITRKEGSSASAVGGVLVTPSNGITVDKTWVTENNAEIIITSLDTNFVSGEVVFTWQDKETDPSIVYATSIFSVKVIASEEDYSLICSRSVVNISNNDKIVSFSVKKHDVSGASIITAPLTSNPSVQIYINDSSSALTSWNQYEVASNSPVKAILKINDVVWDEETIDVVQNGADSTVAGPAGHSGATIALYKRSLTVPTVDVSDLEYTFNSKTLSGDLKGWSQEIPQANQDKDPCYVIYAYASSNTDTDTIDSGEWSTPMLAEGTEGENGINTATIFLYQRSASAPTDVPNELTYSFDDGTLTGTLGNWSQTIPAANGSPCYFIQDVVASRETSITISESDWSSPQIYAKDGNDGRGIVSTTIHYAITDALVDPTTIDANSWKSWNDTPPVGQEKYLWTRTIIDYTTGSDTVSYTYSYQGKNGTAGTSVTVKLIEYQAGAEATSAPTGTWTTSIPTVSQGQYLWSKTTFSDGKVAYGVSYQSIDGDPAQDFNITADSYVLKKSSPTATTYSNSVTLTAHKINITGDVKWYKGSTSSSALATANTYTVTTPGTYYAVCGSWSDSLKIGEIADGATGPDGKPAIAIMLTNPTMTFHASTANEVEYCEVIVYEGGEKLTQAASGDGTFSIAKKTDSQTKASIIDGKIKVSDPSADGSATFTVTVRPKSKAAETSQDYTIYWTVVKNGNNGNSVATSVTTQYAYYLCNSAAFPSDASKLPTTGKNETLNNGWNFASGSLSASAKYEYISERTKKETSINNVAQPVEYGDWKAEPTLWAKFGADGQKGSDAEVTRIKTMNALTNNLTKKGIYYADQDGKQITDQSKWDEATGLFINADMINSGALQVADSSGNVKFSASIGNKNVDIGGFTVGTSYLANGKDAYDDANNGVYIGTDGISLGNKAFYVLPDGTGRIGKFDFSAKRLRAGTGSDVFYICADPTFGKIEKGSEIGKMIGLDGTISGAILRAKQQADATFAVMLDGAVYATQGVIGGWHLSTSGFKSKNNIFEINSNPIDYIYLKIGTQISSTMTYNNEDVKYYPNIDGSLHFTAGTILGNPFEHFYFSNAIITKAWFTFHDWILDDDGNEVEQITRVEDTVEDGLITNVLDIDTQGNIYVKIWFDLQENISEEAQGYFGCEISYKTSSFEIDSDGKINSPTTTRLQQEIGLLQQQVSTLFSRIWALERKINK